MAKHQIILDATDLLILIQGKAVRLKRTTHDNMATEIILEDVGYEQIRAMLPDTEEEMPKKNPAPREMVRVPLPPEPMVITRDFLAAIGFERESDGARKYKPDNIEIWNRSDFEMSVAFYKKPPEGFSGKIQLGHWDDIEKTSISDFVNNLLDRQKAFYTELSGK